VASGAVVKATPSGPDAYPAEAAGLRWLADAGGARVAEVLAVSEERIEIERIDTARPTRERARAFGAALAVTHSAGAAAFGSPPDGWSGRIYIGRREMASASEATWGAFYARDRVLPFLSVAERPRP
jgi:fructosamine-3-kinase